MFNDYSKIFTWQAHNALFIIRCVTKLLMENMTEQEVLMHLQQTTQNNDKEGNILISYLKINFKIDN